MLSRRAIDRSWTRWRRGASAVEYLVVIVLVSITALSSYRLLGKSVRCRIAAGTRALAGLSADSTAASADDECDDSSAALPPPTTNSAPPVPSPGITCVGTVCGRPGSQCFVAGTLVVTESGPQAIETIPVGARVWSRDQDGDSEGWKTVVQTYARMSRSLVQLTISNGAGDDETFWLTPNHLVHSQPRGWIEAGALDPATDALVDDSGARLPVRAVAAIAEAAPVFNLEVEDFHTYFVGDARIWVHNGFGDKLKGKIKGKGKGRSQIGRRVPVTIPPGSPGLPQGGTGEGLVISEDGNGNSEFEANINGQRVSGTINADGTVTTSAPSQPKVPYHPGDPINGMPVTQGDDGHGTTVTRVGNNIIIYPPEEPNDRNGGFIQGTLTDLNTIASKTSGSALLNSIETRGQPDAKPVQIRWGNGFGGGRPNSNVVGNGAKFRPGSSSTPGTVGSGGSGNLTMTTPEMSGLGIYEGDNDPNIKKTHPVKVSDLDDGVIEPFQQGWGRAKNKPSDVALYHELVHADDSRRGLTEQRNIPAPSPPKKWYKLKPPPPPTTIEVGEERSVGLGSFAGTPYNENRYRQERNLPTRDFYNNPKEVYSTDEQRGYTVPSYVNGDPRLPSHPPPATTPPTTPPTVATAPPTTNAPATDDDDPPSSPTNSNNGNGNDDDPCG